MTEPRDRAPDDDLDAEIGDADGVVDEGDDLADETFADDLADDGVEAIDDQDLDDEAVGAGEAEIDDYDAAVAEIAGDAAPVAIGTAAERRSSAVRRRTPGRQPARAPSPSEIAVHVRENVSKAFVIAAVAVYIVILLNAIFLGTGGVFRPLATPTPAPTESPSVSPSGSASPSASGGTSPEASAPASAPASVAPSPNAS